MKHTPGIWTFRNDSMTGAVWAEKELIASVYPNAPEGWDGASENERLDEMRANARLIAAAPDLLEAVRALKAAFGDPVTRRALGGHNERQMVAILSASAAIARARGEQDGGGHV